MQIGVACAQAAPAAVGPFLDGLLSKTERWKLVDNTRYAIGCYNTIRLVAWQRGRSVALRSPTPSSPFPEIHVQSSRASSERTRSRYNSQSVRQRATLKTRSSGWALKCGRDKGGYQQSAWKICMAMRKDLGYSDAVATSFYRLSHQCRKNLLGVSLCLFLRQLFFWVHKTTRAFLHLLTQEVFPALHYQSRCKDTCNWRSDSSPGLVLFVFYYFYIFCIVKRSSLSSPSFAIAPAICCWLCCCWLRVDLKINPEAVPVVVL